MSSRLRRIFMNSDMHNVQTSLQKVVDECAILTIIPIPWERALKKTMALKRSCNWKILSLLLFCQFNPKFCDFMLEGEWAGRRADFVFEMNQCIQRYVTGYKITGEKFEKEKPWEMAHGCLLVCHLRTFFAQL